MRKLLLAVAALVTVLAAAPRDASSLPEIVEILKPPPPPSPSPEPMCCCPTSTTSGSCDYFKNGPEGCTFRWITERECSSHHGCLSSIKNALCGH